MDINTFIARELESCINTAFYETFKLVVDAVRLGDGDISTHAEILSYNKWSIIPVVYPLCIYYGRKKVLRWLLANIDYSRTSSKDVLAANMRILKLPLDEIPDHWRTTKNLLPQLCDNMEATLTYLKEYPDSFKKLMESDTDWLYGCSIELLKEFQDRGLFTDYSCESVLTKCVDPRPTDDCVQEEKDKLKYLVETLKPSHEVLITVFPSVCWQMCGAIAGYLPTNMDRRKYYYDVIVRYDEEIYYPELDDSTMVETVFYCATKLGLNGSKLCRGILSIPLEYVRDYISDFNRLKVKYG